MASSSNFPPRKPKEPISPQMQQIYDSLTSTSDNSRYGIVRHVSNKTRTKAKKAATKPTRSAS